MTILGIETSCDETAAAVVENGYLMHSNAISSSVDLHKAYGGVVPEIAARSHIEVIIPVIDEAMHTAKVDWDDIDAIAVTYGPGLSGSLLIGVMTAKTMAITKNKPLYAINHVVAHPFASFITKTPLTGYKLAEKQPQFPALALIVSGGHTQLVLYKNYLDYSVLGQTQDDAVGEAFDKVAKIIGLPYPGGPSIAEAAKKGDPEFISLPQAKMLNPYDFSFSGLKTATLRAVQQVCGKSYDFPSYELAGLLNRQQVNDIAASFQAAAVKALSTKTVKALAEFTPASVVVAGGVAANHALREALDAALQTTPFYPDTKLCGDNAAMIASLAFFASKSGQNPIDAYSLEPLPSLSM